MILQVHSVKIKFGVRIAESEHHWNGNKSRLIIFRITISDVDKIL